jgi:hypothetical protein
MATKWVVTAPADHVELDSAQQGQTTFTVTNPTDRLDRVVFDVVPGDGADPAWFTVDEPQRRVPPNGSVSYLVKTAIPGNAKAGAYSVQGRAYSADSVPEEDSVLSGRLAVDVKPKAAPPARKKVPWWIPVVAGLVVVVAAAVTVVVVLTTGGSPKPSPSASASASASGTPVALVGVPDLNHQQESTARDLLGLSGLTVGTVRHANGAPPTFGVIYQSLPVGAMVPRGSAVDLVVSVTFGAPVLTGPTTGTVPFAAVSVPRATPVPVTPTTLAPSPSPSVAPATQYVLRWSDPDPFVTRWVVTIQQQMHLTGPLIVQPQNAYYYLPSAMTVVNQPGYNPVVGPAAGRSAYGDFTSYTTSTFQWWVTPIDDFGNLGPTSSTATFVVV